MMNRLKLSPRLVTIAVIFALALAFATTSLASAASVEPAGVATSASCVSATPVYQIVAVGQPANLTLSAQCTIPPQRLPDIRFVVTWGDGSSSTYVYCLEVCRAFVSASHVYTAVGDYYPSVCLVAPTSTSQVVYCTSVEIKVLLPVD
jgi:hypothetical protein